MIIYNSLNEVDLKKSIVSVGKFDGLHIGHREIVKRMKELKTKENQLVIITFATMPVNGEDGGKMILTQEEKIRYFEMQDVDVLIMIENVSDFLTMSAEDFVKEILIKKLGITHIVCGEDFRFGKDRLGDVSYLSTVYKDKFETICLRKIKYENCDVSSSRIRECIKKGEIKKANKMLSSQFSFIGIVEHGAHLGADMKTPTVNIIPDSGKIIPPFGVYASKVVYDNCMFKSITNIGIKPTVSNEERIGVETHIFDFNEDLYGKIVEVAIYDFIRPEMKFSSIEELVSQINMDVKKVRDIEYE